MSMAPENATSWRDLADELTPEQVEDLEDYDRKTDEFVAALIGPPPFDPREAVLRIALSICHREHDGCPDWRCSDSCWR